MDQDVSQWTTTAVNTTCSSINSLDYRKSSAKFDVTSCGTTESTFGFEFNFSKVKQIKLRLMALSKRLKESRKEKADLMKRIGNMEIQLMNLKDVRGVGDQIFHKDISEKSRVHLINLITDAKEMMDNEKTEEKIHKEKRKPFENVKIERVPSPAQAIPFEPEAKQKWLRRMLAGKTGASLPSVSESQKVVYSKRPNVLVCPVESQHSQLTKNQCSSIPSESRESSARGTIKMAFLHKKKKDKEVSDIESSSSAAKTPMSAMTPESALRTADTSSHYDLTKGTESGQASTTSFPQVIKVSRDEHEKKIQQLATFIPETAFMSMFNVLETQHEKGPVAERKFRKPPDDSLNIFKIEQIEKTIHGLEKDSKAASKRLAESRRENEEMLRRIEYLENRLIEREKEEMMDAFANGQPSEKDFEKLKNLVDKLKMRSRSQKELKNLQKQKEILAKTLKNAETIITDSSIVRKQKHVLIVEDVHGEKGSRDPRLNQMMNAERSQTHFTLLGARENPRLSSASVDELALKSARNSIDSEYIEMKRRLKYREKESESEAGSFDRDPWTGEKIKPLKERKGDPGNEETNEELNNERKNLTLSKIFGKKSENSKKDESNLEEVKDLGSKEGNVDESEIIENEEKKHERKGSLLGKLLGKTKSENSKKDEKDSEEMEKIKDGQNQPESNEEKDSEQPKSERKNSLLGKLLGKSKSENSKKDEQEPENEPEETKKNERKSSKEGTVETSQPRSHSDNQEPKDSEEPKSERKNSLLGKLLGKSKSENSKKDEQEPENEPEETKKKERKRSKDGTVEKSQPRSNSDNQEPKDSEEPKSERKNSLLGKSKSENSKKDEQEPENEPEETKKNERKKSKEGTIEKSQPRSNSDNQEPTDSEEPKSERKNSLLGKLLGKSKSENSKKDDQQPENEPEETKKNERKRSKEGTVEKSQPQPNPDNQEPKDSDEPKSERKNSLLGKSNSENSKKDDQQPENEPKETKKNERKSSKEGTVEKSQPQPNPDNQEPKDSEEPKSERKNSLLGKSKSENSKKYEQEPVNESEETKKNERKSSKDGTVEKSQPRSNSDNQEPKDSEEPKSERKNSLIGKLLGKSKSDNSKKDEPEKQPEEPIKENRKGSKEQ